MDGIVTRVWFACDTCDGYDEYAIDLRERDRFEEVLSRGWQCAYADGWRMDENDHELCPCCAREMGVE